MPTQLRDVGMEPVHFRLTNPRLSLDREPSGALDVGPGSTRMRQPRSVCWLPTRNDRKTLVPEKL